MLKSQFCKNLILHAGAPEAGVQGANCLSPFCFKFPHFFLKTGGQGRQIALFKICSKEAIDQICSYNYTNLKKISN